MGEDKGPNIPSSPDPTIIYQACMFCGAIIDKPRKGKRFCSDKCRWLWNNRAPKELRAFAERINDLLEEHGLLRIKKMCPNFMIDVQFEAYCGKCGKGICNNVTTDDRKMKISIEPCDACLEEAKTEGYNEGYDEGSKKGGE